MQVSGHQLVTVPVSSTNAMYQTVVAANLHSGENQVQVKHRYNHLEQNGSGCF